MGWDGTLSHLELVELVKAKIVGFVYQFLKILIAICLLGLSKIFINLLKLAIFFIMQVPLSFERE
jgi:hypothetical protein